MPERERMIEKIVTPERIVMPESIDLRTIDPSERMGYRWRYTQPSRVTLRMPEIFLAIPGCTSNPTGSFMSPASHARRVEVLEISE